MVLSYSLGSITGAYFLTKWMIGKDIRQLGSGNVGARNAGQQLGKKGFIYTLLIDSMKVFITLYMTSILFPENEIMLLVSSFCLLIGHIWPIQLGFKGGKGVVVFLASTLCIAPIAIVVLGISMGIMYMLVRNFTIAGLFSMAAIPITAYIMGDTQIAAGLFILFAIVVSLHVGRK